MKELWRRIRGRIWRILFDDMEFVFLNHFVASIPFWSIRKLFYLMYGMKLGPHAKIAMKAVIMRPSRISIGKNTVINEYVLLDGRDGLEIGENTSISMYTKIYSGTHISDSPSFEYIGKKTVVKNNCWLGTACIIMPGSQVNDFAIIGANSVFKGEASEKGIYVGVPAVYKRKRNIDEYYDIKYRSWFR